VSQNQESPQGETLLINKPYGWTSFQAVKKIKWLTKSKKVGHAGTLDPLATGLLVICTEKSTKKINDIQGLEKEYIGVITLGNTTPSHDLETEPNAFFEYANITEEQIRENTAHFLGETEQTPPLYSAIKVDGKRAYKMAREGIVHELKARTIIITDFEITKIALPEIHFRVVCSKGTYIRSLAFDFAKKLGTGGHLSSLCRTRIGHFLLENSKEIKEMEEEIKNKATQMANNASI